MSSRPTLTAVPGYLGTAHGEAEPEPEPEGGASAPIGFDQGLGEFTTGLAPASFDTAAEPFLPDQALVDTVETASDQASEEDAESVTLPARTPRILIQRMQLVSAGLGVTTEVTLGLAGRAVPGGGGGGGDAEQRAPLGGPGDGARGRGGGRRTGPASSSSSSRSTSSARIGPWWWWCRC